MEADAKGSWRGGQRKIYTTWWCGDGVYSNELVDGEREARLTKFTERRVGGAFGNFLLSTARRRSGWNLLSGSMCKSK